MNKESHRLAFQASTEIEHFLELSVRAALRAGAEILAIYQQDDLELEEKGDGSPLTRADRAAEDVIVSTLAPSTLPVLSEEGRAIPFAERSSWSRFWLVDPLDGTKEFIKRNGEFTVNIALVEEGRPSLGVVYAPAREILYLGIKEIGAFVARGLAPKEISFTELITRVSSLPDFVGQRPFRVVGSRSHMSPETSMFVDRLRHEHPDLELISVGSSFKFCMIAEGSADLYPRFGPTMEWDTAAAHAIASACGHEVFECDAAGGLGEPLRYNKPNLVNPWFLVR